MYLLPNLRNGEASLAANENALALLAGTANPEDNSYSCPTYVDVRNDDRCSKRCALAPR